MSSHANKISKFLCNPPISYSVHDCLHANMTIVVEIANNIIAVLNVPDTPFPSQSIITIRF